MYYRKRRLSRSISLLGDIYVFLKINDALSATKCKIKLWLSIVYAVSFEQEKKKPAAKEKQVKKHFKQKVT